MLRWSGKVWVLGDNVSTDVLMPAEIVFGGKSADQRSTALQVMASLKPEAANAVRQGDIIVAGRNFGCGSGRPAPRILRALGICAVAADSVARTFFRNATHIGLPVIVCKGVREIFADGDTASLDIVSGVVENRSREISLVGETLLPGTPPFEILKAGGLDEFVKAGGWRCGNREA